MSNNMYEKAKIYKLVNNVSNDCYYGSTCNDLFVKKHQHLKKYKNWENDKNKKYCRSFELYKNNEKVDIILIEELKCDNKMQMKARERHYIENNDCLNKIIK